MRGALGGSRLFDQPQYRAEAEAFATFVAPAGPVAVEIGFDHGHRLLDAAQQQPDVRWVGLEVREARVAALRERAPDNLLAWRADARTVFATLVPQGRLSRVDVWFPTPWWDEAKRAKRLLFTPAFVADVASALAPRGALHVATDIVPYFEHIAELLQSWTPVPVPPQLAPSRRERTCARESVVVQRGSWTPPSSGTRVRGERA